MGRQSLYSRKAGAKMKTSWDKEREYKRLDFSKIQFEKEELSTEESLEEIIPIKWSINKFFFCFGSLTVE